MILGVAETGNGVFISEESFRTSVRSRSRGVLPSGKDQVKWWMSLAVQSCTVIMPNTLPRHTLRVGAGRQLKHTRNELAKQDQQRIKTD